MSILLGQSPQSVYSGTVVYGATRWGHNAISSVYQDTAATIDYIIIKAKRVGVSGNVTIEIWDTPYTGFTEISGLNDGDPITIGNLIGSKTEDSSGWSNSAYDSHTFTFASPVSLPDHGIFIVSIAHPGGGLNNCISWAFPTGSGYTQIKSADGGSSWTKQTGVTGIYQTYGTVGAAPGKPTTPSPANAATNITLDETPLSWVSGGNTDTYEIYWRIQGNAWVLVGVAQAGLSWTIVFPTIVYGTTYEWRIDATNTYGTTTGDTWSFSSIDYDQLRISYRLISGGNGAGPYDDPPGVQGTDWEYTGLNNMISVKRLVVAANSKIFYESI